MLTTALDVDRHLRDAGDAGKTASAKALDPGSGEARPALSLSKGRDDEVGALCRNDGSRPVGTAGETGPGKIYALLVWARYCSESGKMDQAERSYASAMALAERLRLPEVMRAVSQAYAQHAMRAGDRERAANAAAAEQQVPADLLVAPASATLSF